MLESADIIKNVDCWNSFCLKSPTFYLKQGYVVHLIKQWVNFEIKYLCLGMFFIGFRYATMINDSEMMSHKMYLILGTLI